MANEPRAPFWKRAFDVAVNVVSFVLFAGGVFIALWMAQKKRFPASKPGRKEGA